MSSEQSYVSDLQRKGWVLADSKQHPLASLQGKSLNSYRLFVLLGPRNRVGASYFQIFLQTSPGEFSSPPAILGLHNQGEYPSYNWIEIISFVPRLSFGLAGKTSEVPINGLSQQLFQYLADLIPQGGHMMVEYDSPEQQDTARSLALGIPPAATPLGYMLFSIGCGFGFKDWYFAEGGSEGPRKLQGYKALNSQHAQLKTKEMVQELTAFLARLSSEASSELEKTAQDRALVILDKLKHQNKNVTPRVYP
jgi:hypothetical protein